MFSRLLDLFRKPRPRPSGLFISTLGWTEVPESAEAPVAWTVEIGAPMPDWAWNALVRKDLMPVPEPAEGALDWGGTGVRVASSGQYVPLGGTLHRSDLAA